MELKRILARDTRTATEQAIALYGPDVLIVANQRVGGQTELVLALDIEPEPVTTAPPVKNGTGAAFQSHLDALLRPGVAASGPAADLAPVASVASVAPMTAASLSATTAAQDDRDRLRSQELVAMVRDELADLRREFRLSQQAQQWQGTQPVVDALKPLVQALNVCAAPVSLRTLLLDGLREQTDLRMALDQMKAQLSHAISRPPADLPRQGVHVLAGSTGAGKTLMAARLAQLAATALGNDQVALISYRDVRPGAWSQLQILGAQAGVETFRAPDAATLAVLLADLGHRPMILIDTAGVDMATHLNDIRAVCPTAQLHAVLAADASESTLKRVLIQSNMAFSSLMISKFDESDAPWSLLQFLCNESQIPALSVVSRSDRMNEPLMPMTAQELVEHVMNLSGLTVSALESSAVTLPHLPTLTGWMSAPSHA